MIELSTYRHVVLEMLAKIGFENMAANEAVELAIRSGWMKKISARECAVKITRGEA